MNGTLYSRRNSATRRPENPLAPQRITGFLLLTTAPHLLRWLTQVDARCEPAPLAFHLETVGLAENIRLKSLSRQKAPFCNPVPEEKPQCKIQIAPCESRLKS